MDLENMGEGWDACVEETVSWLVEHFNITLKEFEDGGKIVEQLFTTEVEDAFREAMEE